MATAVTVRLVSESAGFSDLLDGRHLIWLGNFTGAGRTQVMFYYAGDGHWFLGDCRCCCGAVQAGS
jgi:hypothetical protein